MANRLRSGWTWLVEAALERWPQILIGAASIAMGLIARASKLLGDYGPLAWGAVVIVTGLLGAAIFWLASLAYARLWITRVTRKQAETASVNPLAGHFVKQRMKLTDFFHAFYQATENAKFEDCEILGPGIVYLKGSGSISYSQFHLCQVVIVKNRVPIIGATAFESCMFTRCKFYHLTFFMEKQRYLAFQAQGMGMDVITQGLSEPDGPQPMQPAPGSGPPLSPGSGPSSPST